MNERVMQFRIGMFVIVAGLVLVMMIIWFGESPTLLRDRVFLKVHYLDAPGVADGIPVRRSGIKIGEVTEVEFDDRPNMPDGVIVTLALDRKSHLKMGSVPKITRALIGDVAIEMMPGNATEPMPVGEKPSAAPLIEGEVSPDPSKMLTSASETLVAIQEAAKGLGNVAKRAERADELIATFIDTGKKVGSVSDRIEAVLKDGEGDIKPTLANIRTTTERLNKALDDKTVAEFKTMIERISAAGAKLDASLADLKPLLADLGAPVNNAPVTNFGQVLWRANRVFSDVGLLSRTLADGKGGLNPNGSIQQLFLNTSLYDNWNKVGMSAQGLIDSLRPVVASLRGFADRVNRDPSALTRGRFSADRAGPLDEPASPSASLAPSPFLAVVGSRWPAARPGLGTGAGAGRPGGGDHPLDAGLAGRRGTALKPALAWAAMALGLAGISPGGCVDRAGHVGAADHGPGRLSLDPGGPGVADHRAERPNAGRRSLGDPDGAARGRLPRALARRVGPRPRGGRLGPAPTDARPGRSSTCCSSSRA